MGQELYSTDVVDENTWHAFLEVLALRHLLAFLYPFLPLVDLLFGGLMVEFLTREMTQCMNENTFKLPRFCIHSRIQGIG